MFYVNPVRVEKLHQFIEHFLWFVPVVRHESNKSLDQRASKIMIHMLPIWRGNKRNSVIVHGTIDARNDLIQNMLSHVFTQALHILFRTHSIVV